MMGYCVKEKKKKEMVSAKTITKGSRKMVQGLCKTCGTKMSVFTK